MSERAWNRKVEEKMKESLIKHVEKIIESMESDKERMEDYKQRMEQGSESIEDLAQWALNHLENVTRNFNFTEFSRRIGEYRVAKTISELTK